MILNLGDWSAAGQDLKAARKKRGRSNALSSGMID